MMLEQFTGPGEEFSMSATRLALLTLFAVSAILVASPVAGALGSPTQPPADTHAASAVDSSSFTHPVDKKFFPRSYDATILASVGTVALSVLLLNNGSEQVVLFKSVADTTHVVQAVLPGGPLGFANTVVAAGGNFFLQAENLALDTNYFEEISPTGVVSTPPLPVPLNGLWTLIGDNSNRLFATGNPGLISINPWTFAVEANFTSLIPANVGVAAVFSAGPILEIGGSLALPTGGSTPFFGFINTVSFTETTLSSSVSNNPSGLDGGIDTIAQSLGYVFFGGFLQIFSPLLQTVVGGYLFEFSPYSDTVTNLSYLAPISNWAVFAIFNLGPAVVMTIGSYHSNETGVTQVSGTYLLAPSPHALINETRITGSHFAALYLETSVTAGIFFVGGVDLKTNIAEIVAFPAKHLLPA
jgi:hypothetical protein